MTHVERATYTNSKGDVLVFGENGLYIEESEINGWKISHKELNGKIIGFESGVNSFPLKAVILCDTDEQANKIRNRIHDITVYDIATETPGVLECRGYKLNCYINDSTPSGYTEWLAFGDIQLNVITDEEYWTRINHHEFRIGDIESVYEGIDFEYDFEHDLGNPSRLFRIDNTASLPSDFIFTIYGDIGTPSIRINGHEYSCDVSVPYGNKLVIDSMNRTIILTNDYFDNNVYHTRNKDSYIFEKLPPGKLYVQFENGEFDLDVDIIEQRKEPLWI